MSNFIKYCKLKSYNGNLFYRLIYKGYLGFKMVFDSAYRQRILQQFRHKKNYLQFSTYTSYDRYPDLFSILQKEYENNTSAKILSFGCATGEEVATINTYLPKAHIWGVDINEFCIKQARKKCKGPNITLVHTSEKSYFSENDFDAILCLAVFQHPRNRHQTNLETSSWPFEKFETEIAFLCNKLKPGGLLFIDHCDFNFIETSSIPDFEIFNTPNNPILRDRPIFNKLNQKVSDQNFSFRIFKKK
jgi:SAM-dependent methyltransferase